MNTKKPLFQKGRGWFQKLESAISLGEYTVLIRDKFEYVEDDLKRALNLYLDFSTEKNNPDFFTFSMPTIGIDDIRLIIEKSILSPINGTRKVFFITTKRILIEAQQAMLKFLEEPSLSTKIFFIIEDDSHILPTIKSRLFIIRKGEGKEFSEMRKMARDFLRASSVEKIKTARSLALELKKEKIGRETVTTFFDEVEKEFLLGKKIENFRESDWVFLQKIEKLRDFSRDKGALTKQILSTLAISAPAQKD